jgi:hypothetical protein
MIETTNLMSLDLSIFIVLFGALFLYFGKIIGDTKVEKYEKLGYYIEGLIFSSVFVFIPFIFAYYLKDVFRISSLNLFFIQIPILGCLTWNIFTHEYLRRHGLLGELKKAAEQKLNQIKEQNSIMGKVANREGWIMSGVESVYYNIPIKLFGNKYILLLFSFETMLSNFRLFESTELIFFGVSLLFTFLILTMVALAYGYNNADYPYAKIYLGDDKIIEGKIVKFGDYVYLVKDDKMFFVNQDKITYVEKSLFKEKRV